MAFPTPSNRSLTKLQLTAPSTAGQNQISIMGDPITQDVRALWLRLRKNGGWWTPDMLTHHWKPTYAPHEVQHAMDALEAGGFVKSRDQATNLSYSVTVDCEALPGFEPLCLNQKVLNDRPTNAPQVK